MPRTKKSTEERLCEYAKDYKWLELKDNPEKPGFQLFRCSCCAINPDAGNWSKWREATDSFQKSLVDDHSKATKHAASVRLSTQREANKSFWNQTAAKAEAERKAKIARNKAKATAALFLAREELPIRKFKPLMKLLNNLDVPDTVEGSHTSEGACWSFVEAANLTIMRGNAALIRNADMHCVVLDTTNDSDEWLVVLARCCTKGQVRVIFWDLLMISDGTSATFSKAVVDLHVRDSVPTDHLIGWSSDGCSAMMKASRLCQDAIEKNLIVSHCSARRLDLAVSTDTWEKSQLCKRLEQCMRYAYIAYSIGLIREGQISRHWHPSLERWLSHVLSWT